MHHFRKQHGIHELAMSAAQCFEWGRASWWIAMILCVVWMSGTRLIAEEPLKVLVITGGCCHDYDYQTKALQLAAKEEGVAIEWTVVFEGGTGTKAQIDR